MTSADAQRRFHARADRHSWLVDEAWDAVPLGEPATWTLGGMPIAVKSNFAVAGLRTIAGSRALEDGTVATEDCEAVARVRRAGAAVVGTTNMNELAYGFTGRNASFGDVPNPHDSGRLSGGSSSGSGAIVGAGVLAGALGTDTNGSVRVPAALCGVWGLRPRGGSVPTEGVVPLSTTLDVPGPLACNVAILRALAAALGVETADGTDAGHAAVRVVRGFPADHVVPAVAAGVRAVAVALGAVGEVELEWAPAARAAAHVLTAAEAGECHRTLLVDAPDRLEPLTRARLRAGLAMGAPRRQCALEVRRHLCADLDRTFAGADVLVLPTVPFTAPRRDVETVRMGDTDEPVNAALGRCTMPFSFIGAPAVSVPMRERDEDGLPIGVQLVGRPGADALLLALAAALEADGVAAAHTGRG